MDDLIHGQDYINWKANLNLTKQEEDQLKKQSEQSLNSIKKPKK